MARSYNYRCTQCGKKPHPNDVEARAMLTSKVILFKEVGYRGVVLRSRVVAWLCPDCLQLDPTFNSADRVFIEQVAVDGKSSSL